MRVPESNYDARWWHLLDDGRLQCDLCPRDCKLHEGQRGLCFVRKREGDRMLLTTYGRSSGFCIDPIEKKPLNHFLPGTSILSFGTAGCNLACKFCQNWDISKSRETDTLVDAALPESIARAAQRARLLVGGLHVQRSGDLRRVRDGRRRCVPCTGRADRRRDRRLHLAGAAPRAVRENGRRQRRPQGVHRRRSMSRSRARSSRRCWRRCATCATRPTCGSRSRRCSSRDATTATRRSTR